MSTFIDGDHWLGKQILDEIVVQLQGGAELTLIQKLGITLKNNGKEFYYDYDCIRGKGQTAALALTDFYRKFNNQKIMTHEINQNPNFGIYWVGKVVELGDQIKNWDWADDVSALSKEFSNPNEWYEWRDSIGMMPVLITGLNDPNDTPFGECHFYWTFADGTMLEAPCCICDDKSGFGKGPQFAQHIQDEIDRFDEFESYFIGLTPKQKALAIIETLAEPERTQLLQILKS